MFHLYKLPEKDGYDFYFTTTKTVYYEPIERINETMRRKEGESEKQAERIRELEIETEREKGEGIWV